MAVVLRKRPELLSDLDSNRVETIHTVSIVFYYQQITVYRMYNYSEHLFNAVI